MTVEAQPGADTDAHWTPPLEYYQTDDGRLVALDREVSTQAWIRTDSHVDIQEAR